MQRTIRTAIGLGLIAALALFVGRVLVTLTSELPLISTFESQHERGGCPSTDNCVSSYAPVGSQWAIDPIECDANVVTSEAAFADAIATLRDVETVNATAWIVYSRTFRFPDDVRIEVSARGIEVISSSRLGSGDLGVNRRRVEALRLIVEADPRCSGF